MKEHRIYSMKFKEIYPHYVTKVEKKNRTEQELLALIEWLTGYNPKDIQNICNDDITFKEFFDNAPMMNENRHLITGSICGYKVQEIEEPLMKSIRQLDKIVDELAKGKEIDKIQRK